MTFYGNNWGLIGHEWAVDLLARRLAMGRMAHATLITGPASTGRTALALRLAQAINCRGESPPCGQCRACALIERRGHPDLHFIEPEGRSIKIEQMRDLQVDLTLHPMEARYRVAIIREFQRATDSAADALLKTLEEPPASTRLILTASAAESVFPTIVSRCQVIALRPVPVEQISAALMERTKMDTDRAAMLARLSGGRPGWALSAASDPTLLEARGKLIDDLLNILGQDRAGRFAYSEAVHRTEDLTALLEIWRSWWRDMVLLVSGSQVAPANADRADELAWLAEIVSLSEARMALDAVCSTLDALERNANARLALDVMLLRMPYLKTADS